MCDEIKRDSSSSMIGRRTVLELAQRSSTKCLASPNRYLLVMKHQQPQQLFSGDVWWKESSDKYWPQIKTRIPVR